MAENLQALRHFLKQLSLVPLDLIHMIQVQLNLALQGFNAFSIGQFPAIKLIF
jgi:hypothetical protein